MCCMMKSTTSKSQWEILQSTNVVIIPNGTLQGTNHIPPWENWKNHRLQTCRKSGISLWVPRHVFRGVSRAETEALGPTHSSRHGKFAGCTLRKKNGDIHWDSTKNTKWLNLSDMQQISITIYYIHNLHNIEHQINFFINLPELPNPAPEGPPYDLLAETTSPKKSPVLVKGVTAQMKTTSTLAYLHLALKGS